MQHVISDIQNGKYVELDISVAYDVILKTQSLGADWNIFLENAQSAVLHTEFCPCINICNLRDYVLRELDMPSHKEDSPPDRMKKIFDSATIDLQRYDIDVKGSKGKISIWRTPTERDFDRARSAVIFVLEFFQKTAKGSVYVANNSVAEITITIRGVEKFFDINIKSGINHEAWVAFDFR